MPWFTPSTAMLLAIIFGLLAGSFINAAEYRLQRGLPLGWRGGQAARSRCRNCDHTLSALELIPLLSFMLQRGRCRACRQAIHWQYPLVEVTAAVLAVVPVIVFGASWQAVAVAIIAQVFLFIFVFDLKYQLILDRITIPAILLALPLGWWLQQSLSTVLVGGIIGGGFFLLQYVLSRGRWIGGGDIRLGLLIGLLLGWEKTILTLFLAYCVGAIIAVGLLLSKQVTRKTTIPFGTFLSAATIVALLWGDRLLDWYLGRITGSI